MPTKELQTPFFVINGDKIEQLYDCPEQIEASELEEHEFHDLNGNDGLEISFGIDKQEAQKLYAALQPAQGRRVEVEVSCVCDGTILFAVQLMLTLARLGATNIKFRRETVENPDPAWMSCRFIATGIVWNTNNFRKMHGFPMKRRNK